MPSGETYFRPRHLTKLVVPCEPTSPTNHTVVSQEATKSGLVLHIHGNSNVVTVAKRATTPKKRQSDDRDDTTESKVVKLAGGLLERLMTCCMGSALVAAP